MDLPVSINTLGAIITLGLGLAGLFAPHAVARFCSLTPDDERGVSEIRALFGGFLVALGAVAILAQDAAVFRAIAIAWFGAAGARTLSVVRDDSRSTGNLASIAAEILLGLSMILSWDTFFGS